MKIYTEVNYEWKDGELVKTSSESFEYSGDIALCKGGGGNPFKKITVYLAALLLTLSDLRFLILPYN